ncbi:MAG: hypothetical protein ACFFG0_04040 [Candidatus Thorarchaeota archaeon]
MEKYNTFKKLIGSFIPLEEKIRTIFNDNPNSDFEDRAKLIEENFNKTLAEDWRNLVKSESVLVNWLEEQYGGYVENFASDGRFDEASGLLEDIENAIP